MEVEIEVGIDETINVMNAVNADILHETAEIEEEVAVADHLADQVEAEAEAAVEIEIEEREVVAEAETEVQVEKEADLVVETETPKRVEEVVAEAKREETVALIRTRMKTRMVTARRKIAEENTEVEVGAGLNQRKEARAQRGEKDHQVQLKRQLTLQEKMIRLLSMLYNVGVDMVFISLFYC